jgi:putative nucleotidyltransferase-like protein
MRTLLGALQAATAMAPGLVPRPHQRRLIEAALLGGDNALGAWRSWRAHNAPDTVDRASQRLLPLVYRNLRDNGVPESELRELKDSYDTRRDESERRLRAARPMVAALVDAGIDVLILKGAALARFYGGDLGLRPMRDIDLLVRTRDAERAAAALSRLGYEPTDLGWECLERFAFRRLHARSFVAPGLPEVDLHWHALHDARQPTADDDFWEGAVPLDFEGISVKALNATDQLLHVCVHSLQPEKRGNLRWYADAMRILCCETEPIDWKRLLDQALRRRLILQVRYCLECLRSAVAAPIPVETVRAFGRARTSWLERVEFRARTQERRPPGTIAQAVLAYQTEIRGGHAESVGTFLRFLPRHLWATPRWWQMPAWAVLDRVGLAPRPGTSLARRLFDAALEPSDERPLSYWLGQRLAFCRNGNGLSALRTGWSYAEGGGVWSDGAIARLELHVEDAAGSPLRLEADLGAALVGASKPRLDVDVLVNSSRVARWRFIAPITGPRTWLATIPAGLLSGARSCTIDFRILRPRSPASLGLNEDERLLGFYLSSLQLSPTAEVGGEIRSSVPTRATVC